MTILTAVTGLATKVGCSVHWEEHERELEDFAKVLGADLVKHEFESYARWFVGQGHKVVGYDGFKRNRLATQRPKKQQSSFTSPPKPNTHPLPKYDLDAWQYMLSMQRGEEAINDMTINKLQWKLESYNGTATKDAVSRFIAEYRSGIDMVAKSKETGRDPDIIIQLRVLNWFAEETKVVPESFKELIATIKQTHIRELCERKIKERLTQPLPIKRRNPVNNLFKSVTAQYIKPVVEVIPQTAEEKKDLEVFNDIMQGELKVGSVVIDVQPLPVTDASLDKEEQQQDELANFFEISGREPLSTVDIPF